MASKYWIKLYHEVLYDPKMAKLKSHLWRRVIECFLFAGEEDNAGYLPEIEDMAWTLHTSPEILEAELNDIATLGIVDRIDGGWFVVKFAERQAPSPAAKRMAEYRKRKRKEEDKQITEADSDTYRTVTGVTIRNESVTERQQESNLPKLPTFIATPALMTKWGEWCQYQQDKGHPLVYRTAKAQQDSFAEWGEARSIAAMDFSMAQGYKGLVDPVGNSNQRLTPLDHSKAAIKRALGD